MNPAERSVLREGIVAGVVAMAKASTHTVWGGCSLGCPSAQPIVNGPAATSTKSTRI